MKKQTSETPKSITGRMLKPLADLHKENAKWNAQMPSISQEPIEPAAEYQDDGGGYNPTFVVPQK